MRRLGWLAVVLDHVTVDQLATQVQLDERAHAELVHLHAEPRTSRHDAGLDDLAALLHRHAGCVSVGHATLGDAFPTSGGDAAGVDRAIARRGRRRHDRRRNDRCNDHHRRYNDRRWWRHGTCHLGEDVRPRLLGPRRDDHSLLGDGLHCVAGPGGHERTGRDVLAIHLVGEVGIGRDGDTVVRRASCRLAHVRRRRLGRADRRRRRRRWWRRRWWRGGTVNLEDLALGLDVFVVDPSVVELAIQSHLVVTVLDGRAAGDVEVLAHEVAVSIGSSDLERASGDPSGAIAALHFELDVAVEALNEVVELEVERADLGLVALGSGFGTESVDLDGPLIASRLRRSTEA